MDSLLESLWLLWVAGQKPNRWIVALLCLGALIAILNLILKAL